MTNLPKRTKAQRTGESAADLLNSVLTEFCIVIPVPQSRDLGIDFICEIMREEYPTGKLFNVQCKGTEEAEIKNKSLLVPIAVKTLNYWLIQPNPTFLIVVDRKNQFFYWSFPKDFLELLDKKWQEQKTVSIPVSTQNRFEQTLKALPTQLVSIVDSQASVTPRHGDYLGTLTLADAIEKAIDSGLYILSKPFHRPFQYIGMSLQEAAKAVEGQPNEAGNIIIDSEQGCMVLEAEGNFINYVNVDLKKTAPCCQSKPFDSEPLLGSLSINPSELELVRKQTHFHTYYDHKRRLKIGVSCPDDGASISVGFSSKYYGM